MEKCICENCGIEFIPIDKYHTRFCTKHCANSYSSKHNIGKKKIVKCYKCGKDIEVDIRSRKNILCDDCKKLNKKKSQIKTINKGDICNICGQKKNKECFFCVKEKHSLQQIKSLIKHFGFNKSKVKTKEVFNEFYRIRDMLYDMYWNKNMSGLEIAKTHGYSKAGYSTVCGYVFKYLNIPVRSFSESITNAILKGNLICSNNSNHFKFGYHTTWDNNKIFYRSSYELDYAKELDENKIYYEVEKLKIKYWNSECKTYKYAIPDFYIPSQNMIVEIKSNYTLNLNQMKDKFKAYQDLGYNTKLILEHKEVDINKLGE